MARFQPGDGARLLFDLVNDGTVQGRRIGERLIAAGACGYIKRNGVSLLEETIYDVHFIEDDVIIGCREKELLPVEETWTPARYRKGDRIAASVPLTHKGSRIADAGTEGRIGPTLYRPGLGYVYEVAFDAAEQLCLVHEGQIGPVPR